MHNRHAWTEKTEDGLKREIRVIKNGGAWRFQAKIEGEEKWTYYEEPLESDLRAFREILFRKYQRRRAAYEDVVWADRALSRYTSLKSDEDE
jgi:hypothetical protein